MRKRIKVSKNFYLDEFVSPEIYNQYRHRSIWFLDPRLVDLAQAVRNHFGMPVTINNWYRGGRFSQSGHRVPWTRTGSKLSQHKRGAALDLKFTGLRDYEEARDIIRSEFDYFRRFGLTTIEQGTRSWLHLDMRTTELDQLYEVPYW